MRSAHHHPLLLPLKTATLLFQKYAEQLWAQTATKSFVRTITKGDRAGKQEAVTRRGARALTDGAKVTGDFVLSTYWKHADRTLNSPLLIDVVMTDTGVILPSLLINARDLNQYRNMTERSMRNHMTQLKNVGVITGYKWHGSRQSFEVWINPEYVLKKAQKPVEKHAEADSTAQRLNSLLGPIGKKFPPTELPELQETLKSSNWNVINPPSGNPSQETEACNPAECGAQASKSDTGAARAAKTAPHTSQPEDAVRAEFQARKRAAVVSTWAAAKAQLYQNQTFSKEQEVRAQQALWLGEYRDFPLNFAASEQFQADILRRITLVEEYFWRQKERDCKAWACSPWAEMVPGRGYFDVENQFNGFIKTKPWLVEDRKRQRREAASQAIAKALAALNLRRKIDQGYRLVTKTGKARKIAQYIQDNTLMQIFKMHTAFLQQNFGTTTVHRFHKRIQFKLT